MKELSFSLYQRSGWKPKVDVYRSAGGWLVKVELAGVVEQDVQINVQRDSLYIEGQRKDWCAPESQESLLMEITYDRFRRIVQLPDIIAEKEIHTEYREGMLLIHLRNTR